MQSYTMANFLGIFSIILPKIQGRFVQNVEDSKNSCIVCGFMVYYIQNKRKGEQTMVKEYLNREYHNMAATDNYILGKPIAGLVYAARVDSMSLATLNAITTTSKASSKNGGRVAVRFVPNREQWALITTESSEIKAVCTVEYLERYAKDNGINKGQAFEILACKAWNGTLAKKVNLKFTEGGDFTIDGEEYQAKYTKATIIDERTLMNVK